MKANQEDGLLKDIKRWSWATLFITILYLFLGVWMGVAVFSPDSWAYYELAQTWFSAEPYRFVTWRSYFSPEYSASFPFGYPMFLALLHKIYSSPQMAIWGNISLVPATMGMLYLLKRHLPISSRAWMCLSLSLCLFPGYVFEVLSGRSIPLAIFLFCTAFWSALRNKYFFCGLTLGLTTLVRFDMLVSSFLLGLGILLLMKQRWRSIFIVLGFAIGVFPWVVYSQHHFGVNWVSDNSWVALSAKPAFVLDFPAEANPHVKEEPLLWLGRVLGNIPKLGVRLFIASIKFLVLPTLVFFAIRHKEWKREYRNRFVFILGLSSLSLAPYLLTGYFDDRYFALFFVSVGGAFLYGSGILFQQFRSLVICVCMVGILGFGQAIQFGLNRKKMEKDISTQLQLLSACHEQEKETTYIFFQKSKKLAPRYGALFHKASAIAPSNFETMSDVEQKAYFAYMKSYRIITQLPEDNPCHNNKTP